MGLLAGTLSPRHVPATCPLVWADLYETMRAFLSQHSFALRDHSPSSVAYAVTSVVLRTARFLCVICADICGNATSYRKYNFSQTNSKWKKKERCFSVYMYNFSNNESLCEGLNICESERVVTSCRRPGKILIKHCSHGKWTRIASTLFEYVRRLLTFLPTCYALQSNSQMYNPRQVSTSVYINTRLREIIFCLQLSLSTSFVFKIHRLCFPPFPSFVLDGSQTMKFKFGRAECPTLHALSIVPQDSDDVFYCLAD